MVSSPLTTEHALLGFLHQQPTHGYEIHLERATLQFEFAACADKAQLMPLKVLTDKGKVLRPEFKSAGDIAGFVDEIKEVAKAIRTGRPSPILSGALARDALVLCHKQTDSVRRGRPAKV